MFLFVSKLYFLPYIYIFFFFFTFIIMLCLINRQGYLFQISILRCHDVLLSQSHVSTVTLTYNICVTY